MKRFFISAIAVFSIGCSGSNLGPTATAHHAVPALCPVWTGGGACWEAPADSVCSAGHRTSPGRIETLTPARYA